MLTRQSSSKWGLISLRPMKCKYCTMSNVYIIHCTPFSVSSSVKKTRNNYAAAQLFLYRISSVAAVVLWRSKVLQLNGGEQVLQHNLLGAKFISAVFSAVRFCLENCICQLAHTDTRDQQGVYAMKLVTIVDLGSESWARISFWNINIKTYIRSHPLKIKIIMWLWFWASFSE